jgi:hypothetical protein
MKFVVQRFYKYKLGNAPFQYLPDEDQKFETRELASEYIRKKQLEDLGGDTHYCYKIKQKSDCKIHDSYCNEFGCASCHLGWPPDNEEKPIRFCKECTNLQFCKEMNECSEEKD